MKITNIFPILLLAFSSIIYSQKKDNKIYQVIIFKWSKIENTDVKKVVVIDSTGSIFLDNEMTDKKVNLQTFTKDVNKFIDKGDVEKIDANNDPPRRASIPNNNEQNINIAIFLLNDFHNKTFRNKTNYMWRKTGLKVDETNYAFYNFLNKSDLEIIKKLVN